MPLLTKDRNSARVRLLMEAQNTINHETRIEVMMYENRLEILVGLVRDRYGIDSLDSLFAHPEVDDEIKEAVQITMNEMREVKQARYDLSEEFNQKIRDTLMEERSK